jgi:hypothetical protein
MKGNGRNLRGLEESYQREKLKPALAAAAVLRKEP